MRRAIGLVVVSLLPLLGCSDEGLTGSQADLQIHSSQDAAPTARATFPDLIPLPDGFQPEGITSGRGTAFFVGSLADGAIYRGDFRTGSGEVLASPPADRVAVGLAYRAAGDRLFVAGGATGEAYIYDATSGESVASFELATANTFVNDVDVTRDAAYFTDSFRPFLYRVPLGPAGALPDPSDVDEIPLGGDFVFVPATFNANGIVATPDGKHLLIVNSALGTLYRVDPSTGIADLIDLGGNAVPSGDGLLLQGRTLYVVQNVLNQISVVALSADFSEGTVVEVITDPAFRIPTTVARSGNALYAVNARFDTPPTPDTEYEVIRVEP